MTTKRILVPLDGRETAEAVVPVVAALARELGSQPQQVQAVSSAIAYFAKRGANRQATSWAGTIWDDPAADHMLLAPVCAALEVELGAAYLQALAHGHGRALDEVTAEILDMLA